jgi:serine/threonine protein kinase
VALSRDELQALTQLADAWMAADDARRTAMRAEAATRGASFERAFAAMVEQLMNEGRATPGDATLLPPISEAVREVAIHGAFSAKQTDEPNGAALASANVSNLSDLAGTISAPAPRESGQHVGPYRLIKELGRGGMGVVWLAERADGTHARQVALKMPLVENLNWLLAARFARERNILASLEHPSIARLYDAGVDEKTQPYIAIEYVLGVPITDYVKEKKLKPEATAQLFIRVIEAVAHAHTQLVIHRDIKPSNILVDAKGEPHLLDFGIAKLLDDEDSQGVDATQLTRLSGRALTLDYASPEQVNNATLGTASDVYSLGIVLYELLTGSRPYRPKGSTRRDLEQAILDQDPSKPSDQLLTANTGDSESGKSARRMRGDLDTVVLKALRKDPKQRYATAQAFADDLKRYLAYEPIAAKPDAGWYRVGRFVRRNRWALVASSVIAATVAMGVASTLWQAQRAELEAKRANAESLLKDGEATRANTAALQAAKAEQRARVQADDATEQAKRADLAATTANNERLRADTAAQSAQLERDRATAAAKLANAAETRALAAAEVAGAQRDIATEQRNQARTQARRANAMTDFMAGLFGATTVNQVDPIAARKATAVDLLDRGAAQVSSALKDEPLALEAALASLAEMYGQLALPNKAHGLVLKRWQSVEARNGTDTEKVIAAISLGASHIDVGEFTAAVEQGLYVQSKLQVIPDSDIKLRAEAQCLIGRALGTQSPPAAGIPYLKESVRLYRTMLKPEQNVANIDYVSCGKDLAGLLQQPDRINEGLELLESLIGYLQPYAKQVPAMLGGLETVKGILLRSAMRHREASEVTRRSIALYESTGNLEDVMDQKESLALALGPMGQYREALPMHEAKLAYHDGIGNSASEGIVLSRMLYADAVGHSGDARRACQIGLDMFAQNKGKPVYARLLNAYWRVPALECAMAGRFKEADALQEERRASSVRLKQAEPVLLRYLYGMIHLAKEEPQEAVKWLSPLNERDLVISGFASLPSLNGRIAFCRASIKLRDASACERGLRQIEALFASLPALLDLRPTYANFLSAYGEYYLAVGDAAAALSKLRQALEIQEKVEIPDSHRTRRTRELIEQAATCRRG